MDLFSKIFKRHKPESEPPELPDLIADIVDRNDFTYVLKTAELVSGNDSDVMEKVRDCVENTSEFFQKNKERYAQWTVDDDNGDRETLVLTGFIDELTDAGYLFSTDVAVEFEDFLDGIAALKTYDSMNVNLGGIRFNPDRNALEWCRAINEKLKGIRQLCCVDIGGEDLNLVWLNNETIAEIAAAVEHTEISIEAVGIKQY